MDAPKFKDVPLVGILRGISAEHMASVVEALVAAGLGYMEITMNTPEASGVIFEAVKASKGRIEVGAGTVLSKSDLEIALTSGAEFIVTPVMVADVVSECVKNDIPVFPGAFTPKEVFEAWQAGATMVKVFPASMFGPKYFTELKGPFNDIKLMAVGGVRVENIAEYFSCGADAVAFGASVFRKDWISDRDYDSIRHLVAQYVQTVKVAVKYHQL